MATTTAGATEVTARARRWLAAARRLPPTALPTVAPLRRGCPHHVVLGLLRRLADDLEPEAAAARGHATRVAALCGRLALAIGLTPEDAELVALAGRLHDIGETGVPPAAGGEVTGRHPEVGAQLVAPFDVLGVAAPMIRHHHERLDGSGYPDGLRGETIPLGARIIAVADELDHLTIAVGEADALACLAHQARHTLDATLIAALRDRPLP